MGSLSCFHTAPSAGLGWDTRRSVWSFEEGSLYSPPPALWGFQGRRLCASTRFNLFISSQCGSFSMPSFYKHWKRYQSGASRIFQVGSVGNKMMWTIKTKTQQLANHAFSELGPCLIFPLEDSGDQGDFKQPELEGSMGPSCTWVWVPNMRHYKVRYDLDAPLLLPTPSQESPSVPRGEGSSQGFRKGSHRIWFLWLWWLRLEEG